MISSYTYSVRTIFLGFLFSICFIGGFAQGRLVLNGGKINITQGAVLVIDNPNANAITRTTGYISSEGENNIIKWNIGTTTGTYVIPWGSSALAGTYIPVSLTLSAGSGAGYFQFATYQTTDWQNSSNLPSGITNFNRASGVDNSAYATDRFWLVDAQGYTTKPTVSNLALTYTDAENNLPNTITESALRAQRWNDVASTWVDYDPISSINTATNTLTITSVSPSDLFSWWVLTNLSNRHWLGISTSWSSTSNWSSTAGGTGGVSVPAVNDDVFFDASNDGDCVIDADINVATLTVNSGYSGTISQGTSALVINNTATFSGGTFSGGSGTILVAGPFTLNGTAFTSTSDKLTLDDQFNFTGGTFLHNSGTVEFAGTSTQAITGSHVTNFNNILVTNASSYPGVQIQSDQNLRGVLTLADNAVFDADGSGSGFVFKLMSSGDNPTNDAAIDILPAGAQILGNITLQRYMTIEGRNSGVIYRYISSPLQDATAQDIQNEIPITGTFSGASTCTGCGSTPSMYGYTESVTTDINGSGASDKNDGYIAFPASSNSETLQPGKGYSMMVRGNLLTSALWDVSGIPTVANVTPVDLPVSFTSTGVIESDGWNLVGNPFPSTIDWNASSGWTKDNLDASIYITDNGGIATQYATYNGVTGTNGGSQYIALGQAFWVKANGSGTPQLQADENVKAAGTQTTFFRNATPENLIRITLESANAKDDAVIHFRPDATEDFDSQADARKFQNSTINISSKLVSGRNLAINSLPSLNCKSVVKLDVENTVAGSYKLRFSEFESFANTIEIILTDNFTHAKVDVRNELNYNFLVTSDATSYGANRFEVSFSVPPPDPIFNPAAAVTCDGSDASINISNSQKDASYVAMVQNDVVSDTILGNGGAIQLTISSGHLHPGQNQFTIQSSKENCNVPVTKPIDLNISELPKIISTIDGNSCREGSALLKAISSSKSDSYNWYDSETSTSYIEENHDSVFVTPSLSKSKTYYVSPVNSDGCAGLREPVVAKVTYYDDARIVETKDSLISNYERGNQWFFNNEQIPFATAQSLKTQLPGNYSVKVNIDGCITSADYQYVVTSTEVLTNSIKVFPNPTRKELQLEIPSYFRNIKTVTILNGLGQQVGIINMIDDVSKSYGKFDMANLPAGIYILRIMAEITSYDIKIVKE